MSWVRHIFGQMGASECHSNTQKISSIHLFSLYYLTIHTIWPPAPVYACITITSLRNHKTHCPSSGLMISDYAWHHVHFSMQPRFPSHSDRFHWKLLCNGTNNTDLCDDWQKMHHLSSLDKPHVTCLAALIMNLLFRCGYDDQILTSGHLQYYSRKFSCGSQSIFTHKW